MLVSELNNKVAKELFLVTDMVWGLVSLRVDSEHDATDGLIAVIVSKAIREKFIIAITSKDIFRNRESILVKALEIEAEARI